MSDSTNGVPPLSSVDKAELVRRKHEYIDFVKRHRSLIEKLQQQLCSTRADLNKWIRRHDAVERELAMRDERYKVITSPTEQGQKAKRQPTVDELANSMSAEQLKALILKYGGKLNGS